ncbi:serine/alanine adding enzyme [Breznakia sp. PF5-3]|uniref:aminoacyltransferase n=1 Tax=unclassified Breznakia TaxID=2623764 RepID=UPI00240608C3|nr:MULTISPECIES: aminoacyltransferase [unclassified Breznakia]MDF9824479.1 serine/alanine adding enzyme [Breznakia sp. PM6-1]MDF9835238.1 serine/alanine adding enzyme [Breznakia sp. PF5-3]MDF9837434.1 serine/alanine adding enzyme [Breznakia sp. PFB2-8]MDF9859370.1 serine/alanine adding enzyme [Breznakia sp. PH5-24]
MYQFKVGVDAKVHDDFVESHELCNLLQSSSWAKVKENWDSTIVGVFDDDTLIASSLVLIKHLPMGFTMFYTPRGPIMDYTDKRIVKYFLQELKKYAKSKRCLFIKMDPGIHINDYPIGEPNDNHYDVSTVLENMKLAGAIHQGYPKEIAKVIQPRFQANVYKSDTFEKDLPRHTKRLIKDALKRDVQVEIADKNRIDEFSEVVALTEKRKNVNLRNHEYFQLLMDTYGDDAYLFLGSVNIPQSLEKLKKQYAENEQELKMVDEKSRKKINRLQDIKNSLEKSIKEFEAFVGMNENTVIAGVLSIKFGNTMEMLYAGMNDDFKKFMPQYHIYVENMKYAFEHGCDFCNMGGVEGDLQDGLTKFKSNFNPMINEFIGEFDLPVNTLLYKASHRLYEQRKQRMNG